MVRSFSQQLTASGSIGQNPRDASGFGAAFREGSGRSLGSGRMPPLTVHGRGFPTRVRRFRGRGQRTRMKHVTTLQSTLHVQDTSSSCVCMAGLSGEALFWQQLAFPLNLQHVGRFAQGGRVTRLATLVMSESSGYEEECSIDLAKGGLSEVCWMRREMHPFNTDPG